MSAIDSQTYNKARLPVGTGYDLRPKGLVPDSLIIHTTNGQRGSSFAAECSFLYRSAAVGAHLIVSKTGRIVQLLDPRRYRAWHAGVCAPAFINSRSIGIECHMTPGESWTPEQHDALTWLVRSVLIPEFGLQLPLIETHRRVALPAGRKIDPSGWSDTDFYAWRAALAGLAYVPAAPLLRSFVVTTEVNVREAPTTAKPVALGGTCILPAGFVFQSDVSVRGEALASGAEWVHIVQPAAWGFVHRSCVKEVSAA